MTKVKDGFSVTVTYDVDGIPATAIARLLGRVCAVYDPMIGAKAVTRFHKLAMLAAVRVFRDAQREFDDTKTR